MVGNWSQNGNGGGKAGRVRVVGAFTHKVHGASLQLPGDVTVSVNKLCVLAQV